MWKNQAQLEFTFSSWLASGCLFFSKNSTDMMCATQSVTLRMILVYSIIGDFNFLLLVKGVSNGFLHHRVTLHSVSNSLSYGKTFWYYPNVLFPFKPLPTSLSIHWYYLPSYLAAKLWFSTSIISTIFMSQHSSKKKVFPPLFTDLLIHLFVSLWFHWF